LASMYAKIPRYPHTPYFNCLNAWLKNRIANAEEIQAGDLFKALV